MTLCFFFFLGKNHLSCSKQQFTLIFIAIVDSNFFKDERLALNILKMLLKASVFPALKKNRNKRQSTSLKALKAKRKHLKQKKILPTIPIMNLHQKTMFKRIRLYHVRTTKKAMGGYLCRLSSPAAGFSSACISSL